MQELNLVVKNATEAMGLRLEYLLETGMTEEQYVRYLSMQYYLTKDVQRVFMIAASHHDFASRPALRDYLFRIGAEEESHYLVAQEDIHRIGVGREIVEEPLDMKLWHAYFRNIIYDHPLVRIGTHCVLENIVAGHEATVLEILKRSPFAEKKNSRFVIIHTHVDAPHGKDIFDALEAANLTASHKADLVQGARQGAAMYLRLIDWCIAGHTVGSVMQPTERQASLELASA